ncbi:hypothetical protein HPP92_002066 [Vanilla planifolia]|uniref:Uncharacterized protein n=1 Tax=Vanilla planifolia TaxID=51239 RepID=A0A835RRU8_VANPL|nr:hypothetical protein HPP92_002066 [Vanilla planifolia]
MKEDSSGFTRWEEKFPSPDELMPLSQSLITPDLALAFDISPNPTMAPALNRQGTPPETSNE